VIIHDAGLGTLIITNLFSEDGADESINSAGR
jgi:hypothetical protein